MNAEKIICIYFRHMQADIPQFPLLPRLFLLNGRENWLHKFPLIAGAAAPFFIFPSIYFSFYPLSAPPDGGKRLTASEQIRGA
mgnify:FL=1